VREIGGVHAGRVGSVHASGDIIHVSVDNASGDAAIGDIVDAA
jgi:hypothetical protein